MSAVTTELDRPQVTSRAQDADVTWGVFPILYALGWNGGSRAVADALPESGRVVGLSTLRDVLANLGFPSRLRRAHRLNRLSPRDLPAAVWLEGQLALIETIDAAGHATLRRHALGAPETLRLDARRADCVLFGTRAAAETLTQTLSAGAIIRRFRSQYLAVFLLTLGSYIMGVLPALFIMQVYDRVLQERSVATLIGLLVPTLVALAVDAGLRLARGRVLNTLGARLSLRTTGDIFAGFLSLPVAIGERMRLGVKVQRLQQTETLRDTFAGSSATTLIELPFALIFIAALGIIGGPLAIVPVASMVVYAVLAWLIGGQMSARAGVAGRAGMLRQDFLFETFANLLNIRVAGGGATWTARHRRHSEDAARAGYSAARIAALVNVTAQAVTVAAGTATIAWGALRTMDGQMSMGALVAVMTLTWRAITPLQSVFLLLTRINQIGATIRSLDQAVRGSGEDGRGHTDIPPATCGQIEFSRVSFRYSPDMPPALINANLRIEPGEIVAITGANGSGKSTLLKQILGLYVPQAGSVLIDGIDVRQHAGAQLRQAIGYAPQSETLFHGTLRDNLRLADPTASWSDIAEAVRRVRLDRMLGALEGGLDHVVGYGSAPLPGALTHGLALAAAYLRDGRVLLLDEVADHLDEEMRAAFGAELERMRGDVTTVFVTHRPELMRRADRIIVMNDGTVARSGTPAELMTPVKGSLR